MRDVCVLYRLCVYSFLRAPWDSRGDRRDQPVPDASPGHPQGADEPTTSPVLCLEFRVQGVAQISRRMAVLLPFPQPDTQVHTVLARVESAFA